MTTAMHSDDHLIAAGRIFLQAAAEMEQGRLAEAEQLFRQVLEMVPGHALSFDRIGLIRAHQGDRDEAVACFRHALHHKPDMLDARYNLAILLQHQEPPEAITCFELVLAQAPDHLGALLGLGNALADSGYAVDAVGCFHRALAIDADFAPALVNLGRVLAAQGDPAAALACCERVLALRPQSAEAHFSLGSVLKTMGRTVEAIPHLRAALRIDPAHVRALVNLGNGLKEDGQFSAAANCYERAIALQPRFVDALNNLGHLRREQGQADAAISLHDQAVAADPSNAHARVARCVAQLAVIHRDEAEIDRRRQAYTTELNALAQDAEATGPAALLAGIGASQPFYLPYQGQNDRTLQALYGRLVCSVMATRYMPPPLPVPAEGERIRVGVVSGFFSNHSNWKVPIRGWLTGLDRDRIEVFCYHTGKHRDAETANAQALSDHFVQGPLPLDRWRALILADRPHVLIYPEVGIDPMAVQLAAQRLAAVQCNSWGQPVTSGMPTLDYFLSSDLMEPLDAAAHYTERLVRLSGLSIHYDEQRDLVPRTEARERFGLPRNSVVFWCGQSLFKFRPCHDDVFPRIARALADCELGDCRFLFIQHPCGNDVTSVFEQRMEAAFAAHGLRRTEHCVMLPPMERSAFVASYAASDILLDSIGWSGCNTVLESLSQNLPIVTLPGAFLRGRHAAAILQRIGVPELICDSVDTYCAAAVRLARDVPWRRTMAARIEAGKHRVYRDMAPVTALSNFLVDAAYGRW